MSDNGPRTMPQYLLRQVEKYGAAKVALRQKEFGIWREYTWADSFANVEAFALGLIALGVARGDKICTVGDNDRQYLWGYLALQAVGATQVGIYTDAIPPEIQYIAGHSDSTFALAKDQEQCDKFLEVREQLPLLKRVIYWDERGLWNYDEPWLISFAEVLALGRELKQADGARFERELAEGRGEDLAVICYTSGTTGLPKGAMLTHDNLMFNARLFHEVDPRYDSDNHLSFLPLGWIAEHALGIAPHVHSGLILNFPEEPETVRENLREIAPQGVLYNSRLWENLVAMVQVKMNDASWINRRLYDLFLPVGYRYADRKYGKESVGVGLKLAYELGNLLVFRPLRDKMGFVNVRSAYTGGSALSPDAFRFFQALGVNLRQVYGSTEVTGGLTVHYPDDVKFASVGRPIPESQVTISDEGEILLAGPTVFVGYYKNAEATAEALVTDEEGTRWFRTGDAGFVDEDGHVIFLDRVKDMITLRSGDKYSPQFIQGRLKFSPYIRDVMVIGGEARDFVSALVIIDFGNVGRWAEKRGIGYTTFVDLSQRPEVYALIEQAVTEVNSSLPEPGRVRRFVLLHKEFDADDAEMTRSRKLRRGVLSDRYGGIIEAMYAGENALHVSARVQYQDGSEGVVETSLRIADAV